MSAEENKVIARRFIQVWGQGSLDTLEDHFSSAAFSSCLASDLYEHRLRLHASIP